MGKTYELPSGVTYGTDAAKQLLFGVFNFQPDEIEVFLLTNF